MATDRDIIKDINERFDASVEHESTWRQEAVEDIRFRALDQWDDRVKRSRENDVNGARPCLTLDRTNQYIRQVVNQARQSSPAIKVHPVDSEADPDVAEVFNGIIRHIEYQSGADSAYDTALDSACTTGLGYFRIITKMLPDGNQDIFIQRIHDVLSVNWDVDSFEPDGSDAMWAFISANIPRKQFKRQWPKAEEVDFRTDFSNIWVGQDTVRVAEYFEVEIKQKNIIVLQSGDRLPEEDYWSIVDMTGNRFPIHTTVQAEDRVVKWRKTNGVDILEETEFPASYIPIFPVIGNEYWIDGKRQLSGMVRSAKDAQRLYNYAYSAMIERVALEPKAPFIAAAGQVEQYEQMWRTANQSNRSVLVYDPVDIGGSPVPPPQRQTMDGSFANWMPILQTCDQNVQASVGMYQANLGKPSNETSGKAINARQQQGEIATFHYIDNLSRAMRHAGRVLVELIPKVYDTTRVARIVGEDKEVNKARLDPTQGVPVREVRDDEGKIQKIYNIGIGTYDVTVDVGTSFASRRQEFVELMTSFAQSNPDLFGVAGDLIFKNMDFAGAEEVGERLKKMLPPQLQQDDDEGQMQVPPQVQAQMDQMMQALEQAQQMLQQAGQHVDQLETQLAQAEQEKQGIALEVQKAEVENAQKMLEERAARLEAELAAKEGEATLRVTQMQAAEPGEKQEDSAEMQQLYALQQQLDQLMQVMAKDSDEAENNALNMISMQMAQLQQASEATAHAIAQATQVLSQPKKKTARAVKQADGTYIMESVEE